MHRLDIHINKSDVLSAFNWNWGPGPSVSTQPQTYSFLTHLLFSLTARWPNQVDSLDKSAQLQLRHDRELGQNTEGVLACVCMSKRAQFVFQPFLHDALLSVSVPVLGHPLSQSYDVSADARKMLLCRCGMWTCVYILTQQMLCGVFCALPQYV